MSPLVCHKCRDRVAVYSATDNAGNLQDHPDIGQLQYDGDNRVVQVTNSGNSAQYDYDGEGRRVRKTETGLAAVTTVYVYDAQGGLSAEYNLQGGTPSAGHRYLTADQLGSTRLETDDAQTPINRLDYFPFGQTIPSGETNGNRNGSRIPGYGAAPDLTLQFTGKERGDSVAEGGLDYFGARYFSAAQGRFTSPDWSDKPQPVPYADLKDPQTLNLYSYVRNNPLNGTDPDGHCCWDALVSMYNYAKSVVYAKFEGGRGLGISVKAGPAKIDIEGKNATETRYASPDSTKKQIGELGVKMDAGPVKIGLAVTNETLLATNDKMAPAGEKTEWSVVPLIDLGQGKQSGWDLGLGGSLYVGIGGGFEVGVKGDKILNDILHLTAPPPPALGFTPL